MTVKARPLRASRALSRCRQHRGVIFLERRTLKREINVFLNPRLKPGDRRKLDGSLFPGLIELAHNLGLVAGLKPRQNQCVRHGHVTIQENLFELGIELEQLKAAVDVADRLPDFFSQHIGRVLVVDCQKPGVTLGLVPRGATQFTLSLWGLLTLATVTIRSCRRIVP